MTYALSNPVYIFLPAILSAVIFVSTIFFVRLRYSSWVLSSIIGILIAAANEMIITPMIRVLLSRFIKNEQYVVLLAVLFEILIYLFVYFIIDRIEFFGQGNKKTVIWLLAAAVQTGIVASSESLKRFPLFASVYLNIPLGEVTQKQAESAGMSESEKIAYSEELARQLFTSNVGMILFTIAFAGLFLSFVNLIFSFRAYKNKKMDIYFPLLSFASTVIIIVLYNMMAYNLIEYDTFAIFSCVAAAAMLVTDIVFCFENKLWLKLKKDRV